MRVTLAGELENLVREKLETGLYRDADDVIAEALKLLERLDCAPGAPIPDEALRAELQRGFDDIEAGRYTVIGNEEELRAFFDEL